MSDFSSFKMRNVEIGALVVVGVPVGQLYLCACRRRAPWTPRCFPSRFDIRDEEMSIDDVIERLCGVMNLACKSVMGV